MTQDRRWPRRIYAHGSEPDVRFSFANERTFLAWIRTALALIAAGVALDALTLNLSADTQHLLAILLVALGIACTATSWIRWARAERAMRLGDPLPASGSGVLLALGVLFGAVVLLVALI